MRRHWQYLKYVLRHKYYVLREGRKIHVPLYLLLLHDWTKFLPKEWLPYARTFYKPDGSKQYNETYAFKEAWNHHQKTNKHHWQYWMLTYDRGETVCLVMPPKYFYEMIADWRGASIAITGKDNTVEWYLKNRDHIKLHPNNRFWIENWFKVEESHPEVVAWKQALSEGKEVEFWTQEGKPR